MALSTEELLRKALVVTDGNQGAHLTGVGADFGAAGQAPLSVEQVTQFIELMAASQVMLADVVTKTSAAAKWQESIIDFGARIARPGVEATRLTNAGDYTFAKPSTGIVELSTVLLRAEIPVSDEVFEDNVAGQGFVQSLERLISDQFGFDIEELFVNGDTISGADNYLKLLDGWLATAKSDGNAIDGSTYGQDYQEVFRVLLNTLPDRFKRNLEQDGRFYLPKRTEEKYRDILSSRGTALGDLMLTGTGELRYQSIKVVGVPSFGITANKSSILLANRNNLYAGYHRNMKFETWRDPREGATSFIVTARVDAKVAVPEATAVAYDVDVSV
jgi:HK97 family phage major capsid protein